MIIESKHDILVNDNFEVNYISSKLDSNHSDILKNNTYHIMVNTESKSIIIHLYYTRDIFRLNKVLQKGCIFNLQYTVFNDDSIKEIFSNKVTIENVSLDLSKENNHQPSVTLLCSYE